MTDILKIIDGCKHCIAGSDYACNCKGCAYTFDDECTKHLTEDVVAALERLQTLEQPKLPGIEQISLREEMDRQNLYRSRIIQRERW